MDVRNKVFRLKNELQVLWRTHRWQLLWLFLCVVIGIVIACIVVVNPLMTYSKISSAIIDLNITNATYPKSTIGSFIIGRLIDFCLGLLFLFIVCLNSWTALISFPFLAFRGFALVINLYWVAARYGIAAGAPLLICYTVFLIAVTIIFVCAALFIMHRCTEIRCSGMRVFNWRSFFRTLSIYLVVVGIIALLEWLVYAVILSKIIFLAA